MQCVNNWDIVTVWIIAEVCADSKTLKRLKSVIKTENDPQVEDIKKNAYSDMDLGVLQFKSDSLQKWGKTASSCHCW